MSQEPRVPGEAIDDPAIAPLQAWLRSRLTGERARTEWRSTLETAWNHLLAARVDALVSEPQVLALAESYLAPDRIRVLVAPVVRELLPTFVRRMRTDDDPVARWVPSEAQEAIKRMATAPGLIQDEWIRTFFRQEAVEALMADALYRGLRDFSTILPRVILALLPTSRLPGFGGAGAMGKRMLEEFEKRLEPEIKSFLAGGTQRALARAAEFAIQHKDDPRGIKARTDIVDALLAHSPSFHLKPLSDERLAEVEPIAEAIAQRIASREQSRRLLREAVAEIWGRHGSRTVAEVLDALGLRATPDFDAWADATWPAMRTVFEAPEMVRWIDGLVVELLEQRAGLVAYRP